MNERDIMAVMGWFNARIARLEEPPHSPGKREGLHRLEAFAEVLERELWRLNNGDIPRA